MITSENAVIYTYVLWLIGRRDFGLDLKTLRGVIARWFFMAHTTGRYTSSPESQIEADLGRISDLAEATEQAFCAELDRIVRANFTGDYWDISLPNRLDTSSSRSPALYAYWAALNLLDAELLFSDQRIRDLLDPDVSAPRSIERHHLFPKALPRKPKASRIHESQSTRSRTWRSSTGPTTPKSAQTTREYWPKQ